MLPAIRHHSVAPHPLRRAVAEVHVLGCDCPECEAFEADVPSALTCRQAAAIVAAGFGTATAIAALIDAAGTAAIVADLFHWWLL